MVPSGHTWIAGKTALGHKSVEHDGQMGVWWHGVPPTVDTKEPDNWGCTLVMDLGGCSSAQLEQLAARMSEAAAACSVPPPLKPPPMMPRVIAASSMMNGFRVRGHYGGVTCFTKKRGIFDPLNFYKLRMFGGGNETQKQLEARQVVAFGGGNEMQKQLEARQAVAFGGGNETQKQLEARQAVAFGGGNETEEQLSRSFGGSDMTEAQVACGARAGNQRGRGNLKQANPVYYSGTAACKEGHSLCINVRAANSGGVTTRCSVCNKNVRVKIEGLKVVPAPAKVAPKKKKKAAAGLLEGEKKKKHKTLDAWVIPKAGNGHGATADGAAAVEVIDLCGLD